MTGNRSVYLMLTLLATGVLGVMGYVYLAGNRVMRTNAPLIEAAAGLQLELTTGHLWFEEILFGDRHEDMASVWAALDKADAYVSAMLNGGRSPAGELQALETPELRNEIGRVRAELAALRTVTEERWKAWQTSQAGSDVDQQYDRTYKECINLAHGVAMQLQRRVAREAAIFRSLLAALMIVVLALFVLAGVAIRSHFVSHRRAEAERESLIEAVAMKNEELESIIHATSHDLRSPLVSISGFGQELDANCAELASAFANSDSAGGVAVDVEQIVTQDIPEAVGYIRASVHKMDRLLSGLVRVSRLGRAVRHVTVIDVNTMMRQIVDAVAYQLRQGDVQVTVGDLPDCKGDVDQVNQVFSNLLDNAVKYLSPDRPGRISVTGHTDGLMRIYCVEDNGIGISPDQQAHVFEIFCRIDPRGSVEGEGLGLAVVRRLAAINGGRTWVESELGRGSRFYVALPVGDPSASTSKPLR